ncbi:flavanone 3-dioxygenase 2-like [Miscanthus floridulus]|uniref:flavanone 3-dioxygenase 2-like n=1 Tax=Miscanthus floridulus TaxID=154761 RepID=UPI00345B01EC
MAASDALPVVDLAPFFTEDVKGGTAGATEAVRQACQTHGFFRAVNHGVPVDLMARALELSAAFFALPDEEKAKVRAAQGSKVPVPAGYGRQPAHVADKNEYLVVFDPKLGLSAYPAEPDGFRETVEECYSKFTELGLLIQKILNECMGLPPGFLKDHNDDLMIVRRYLPATEEESTGFSAHEDASCITLICQDDVGGLEVLKDGHWVPAEPGGGSIIVNIGDVIKVLSNSKLKSATHRVVSKAAHRHSLSFFSNPHGDRWVEPLPEFTAKIGEAPRYRGFLYKEYQRLLVRNKTHPPARHEDVVNITRYAI